MASKKQQSEFNKTVLDYLQEIGAQAEYYNSSIIWYKVNTICGLLRVGLDRPEKSEVFTIYCRFENVERAKKYIPYGINERLNNFTGKWNFHNYTADEAMHHFINELSPILVKEPA